MKTWLGLSYATLAEKGEQLMDLCIFSTLVDLYKYPMETALVCIQTLKSLFPNK